MTVSHHEHSEGNPSQHAGGPASEPLGEQAHPTHRSDHDPAHHNDPAHVKAEMRKYWIVFFCLVVLTGITVGISEFHLPTWQAVTLALVVATVKGSLVAAFFMHLISERKLIYAVLVMTVFFFGMLVWGPSHHHSNAEKSWPGYDRSSKSVPAADTAGEHGHH
jgi:cytochrome c oxidase subunit 4